MDIFFNQVLPAPLSSMQLAEDSLWCQSVTIKKGQKVMVEAPSGRGKSTLIHALFGIRKDYTGEIFLDGQLISNFSKATWSVYRKDKIAIVFQDLQLFPQLTVIENLQLKNDLTNHYSLAELVAFMDIVGLSEKLNEKCGKLSMGQQQRVAIIRAICQPFSWLLLDEPFSHLDADNAEICMKIINEACDKQQAGWFLTSLGTNSKSAYDQIITI
jgi:ABC-type lipoprotein export system ATPase subunit